MDHLLFDLKDVMQQELIAYKEILTKSKHKKEALLQNDVAMLDRIVAHEWNLVKTIRQLEKDREGLIEQIAAEYGLPCQNLRLDVIADLLDSGMKAEFAQLKTELTHVISEVEKLNMVNKGLVDTHLQYSAFCVNLLTGHINTLNTYSHSGRMSETQESATLILDRMV